MRMIADVPLGAFLSGGVDSSGVVAMMAGLQAEPVSTFSIAFGSKGWDESAYAAEIAERYRTEHRVREVDPNSFDLVDRLATIYDEPFGDSSAIPTFRVCAMARENVTVALSGDGGDEVFAGYRRYRWHCLEEQVRRLVPRRAAPPAVRALRRALSEARLGAAPPARQERSSASWRATRSRRISHRCRFAATSCGAGCSAAGCCASCRATMPPRCCGRNGRCGSEDPLSQVQYADFKTYLPGDILTKVDRASMANSLEVRVPLLDHTLVEWAARLPSQPEAAWRRGQAYPQGGARTLLSRAGTVPAEAGFCRPPRRLVPRSAPPAAARKAVRIGAAQFGFVRHRYHRDADRPAPIGRARSQRPVMDAVDDGSRFSGRSNRRHGRPQRRRKLPRASSDGLPLAVAPRAEYPVACPAP